MSETIEDVVKSLRDRAEGRRKSGKLLQIDDRMFDLLADRIEAAWQIQLAAEKAKAEGESYAAGKQSVTDCNQQKDWRKNCAACQEGEPPEDCAFYGEPDGCNARPRCVHPTCEKSSQVGNAAKMLKALKQARRVLHCAIVAGILKGEDAHEALNVVTTTLSEPARNCDVGTAKEQFEMFRKYCFIHFSANKSCRECPIFVERIKKDEYGKWDCGFEFLQMPYESEEKQ